MIKADKPQPFSANCPSREILELIGGKWSLLILCLLKAGPQRTGSIMRSVQGISQKMLTQTLRDLERSGIVTRKSYSEVPPRVEYSLTPLGETLSVLVLPFEQWVVDNYEQVIVAQARFDALHTEDSKNQDA
ncbi:transcriptional regulator [Ktedonosporobacter rubrisoli]|uniref:Transcriptional regulator n=2 Tax=Ktedonosporobacter rubrisoli TaxID=2509675 RepID=A0A4P6K6T9_KTERU|nr:transcriptional regulator [Ktedonosporobacter rubrisoli]